MDRVPPGAFPEAAKADQQTATAVGLSRKAAFTSRSTALVEMRKAVNEHDVRLAQIEGVVADLKSRPF